MNALGILLRVLFQVSINSKTFRHKIQYCEKFVAEMASLSLQKVVVVCSLNDLVLILVIEICSPVVIQSLLLNA